MPEQKQLELTPQTDGRFFQSFGRLEAKVDLLLAGRISAEAAQAETSKRISRLELWKAWLAGAWAILTAAFIVLGFVLKELLSRI